MDDNRTRTLVERVEREFPSLNVASARRVLAGWEHVVLEVNNGIIFRFPRYKDTEERLQREIRLLSSLKNRFSVPVPVYKYIAPARKNQYSFAGYRRIPGDPITPSGYRPAWTRNLSRSVARFLRELHTTRVTPRIAQAVPTQGPRERLRIFRKYLARVHKQAYKHMDRKTRWKSDSFLDRSLETFENARYKPVLVHTDLTDRNILVDPRTGGLAGILDWSDSSISDPAIDLCGFFEVNRRLGHRTHLPCTGILPGIFWSELKSTGECYRISRSWTVCLRKTIIAETWELSD